MKNPLPNPGCASGMSDEDLVERVQAGDAALYGVLILRHHKHLVRTAYRLLRNDAEAEDALQEAHMHAFAHIGQFAGRSRFLTWLTAIMTREAFSRLRNRRRFREAETLSMTDCADGINLAGNVRSPEQAAFDEEMRIILEEALKSLPEAYRTVFTARVVQEKSTLEAAYYLGISEQCVKTRLLRARVLLRNKIQSHFLPSTRRRSRNTPFAECRQAGFRRHANDAHFG